MINTPDDARDQNSHGLVVTVMCKTDTVVISPGLATVPKRKCHLEIIVEPLLYDVCKGLSTSVVGIVGSRPQRCHNHSLSDSSNDVVSKTALFISEAMNRHPIVNVVSTYHDDNNLEVRGIGNLSLRPVNASSTSPVPSD